MKRLFLAIPFDDNVQAALYAQALKMQEKLGGRPVRRGNYHLTLRFLGERSSAEETAARRALSAIPAISPFELFFSKPGQFRQDRQALVWMGMEPDPKLTALLDCMAVELAREGFSTDKKVFLPHVTLLRDVPLQPTERLSADWANPPAVKITDIVLFESVIGQQGLFYRPLARYGVDKSV